MKFGAVIEPSFHSLYIEWHTFLKTFFDSQKKQRGYGVWPKSQNLTLAKTNGGEWIPMERVSQEEQNGANFSSIAPSSEEL